MEFSEHIKTANVEDVVLRVSFRAARRGALCVTGHHLLFSDREEQSTWQLLLLLRNIDAIEKSVENLLGYPQGSKANQKQRFDPTASRDLRILQLDIPGMEECLNIASSIEWDRWRLSTVNRDFSVCPSYPSAVIVPRSVDDDTLLKAARFRHGGRFPVLCYCHHSNSMVIMRSSQPMTGANRKRCKEDELLLQAAIDESELGYIIDTRSAQQAQQARMTGGGFESKSCYRPWRRLHRHMERGKVLQESLIKLVEACGDSSHNMDRWLSKMENSKWLSHVHNALSTAGLVAECVERDGHSVLVHGAEGTDTTLVVTSLAQLIMDPECRTFSGFLRLLEREWVQAGHPFQQRCAHAAYSHARLKYECPSFLLFLDCVWQIWRQFPLAMEFSEALLLRLTQEVYASDYGTFLCNNEYERGNQVRQNGGRVREGTSAEQDNRFSNKHKKLLKQLKFAECLEKKVDMTKVNLEVIKPWITQRVTEILGFEDDVVVEFVFNQLEEKVSIHFIPLFLLPLLSFF
ncbi:Myotubularin-related protein 9 [Bagarius yarrelli]|uniref:Myotubularin-related protein 9 n=1 Tax=Bagarius yarrelli TaxID=175774 RepID=A0A556VUW9_BAGYA|nr:Myotubularin-related protein 9 [Bagarius yarrelli]